MSRPCSSWSTWCPRISAWLHPGTKFHLGSHPNSRRTDLRRSCQKDRVRQRPCRISAQGGENERGKPTHVLSQKHECFLMCPMLEIVVSLGKKVGLDVEKRDTERLREGCAEGRLSGAIQPVDENPCVHDSLLRFVCFQYSTKCVAAQVPVIPADFSHFTSAEPLAIREGMWYNTSACPRSSAG